MRSARSALLWELLAMVVVVLILASMLWPWHNTGREASQEEAALEDLVRRQNMTIAALHATLGRTRRPPMRPAPTSRRRRPPPPPPERVSKNATFEAVSLRKEDWVIYLRIQKTGSQTLWQTLVDVFDGKVWGQQRCVKGPFCGHVCAEVLANAYRKAKCHLFVRAHANLFDYKHGATLAGIPTTRLRFLAVLREPVARAVSEYHHVTTGLVAQFGSHVFGKAWDYNFTDPKRASLDDWLDCRPCRVGSSNRQTRFLAGLRPTGILLEEEDSNGDLLDAALRNLQACDFVGVLDKFPESMVLLRETFPGHLQRFSSFSLSLHPKRGGNAAPSPATLDRLRELNALDTALYAAARDIFDQRWALMLESLPEHRRHLRFRPRGTGSGPRRFVLS